MKYTIDELTAAKRQIDSTLHKLRETVKHLNQRIIPSVINHKSHWQREE